MSRGRKLFLTSLVALIALIAVGQFSHHGDPGGTKTGSVLANNPLAPGVTKVPVSQAGLQALATQTGHLGISINLTWLLLTGFLVLFMQVGFAFLVTGLTRAKNAGHMMMMNLSSFVIALLVYYAIGFAFQFGGVAPILNIGGAAPLNGIFAHGDSGLIGLHGFFLQSGNTYDVGVLAFFLFQVVFMETAGYIIIGAIAERITVRRVHLGRDPDGGDRLPDLRHVGLGRRLARPPRDVARPRARSGGLRRIGGGARHRRLGCARPGDDPRAENREVPK